MSSFTPSRLSVLAAVLIVFGSVLFSRLTAPETPQAASRETKAVPRELGFANPGDNVPTGEEVTEFTENGKTLQGKTFAELKQGFAAPIKIPMKSRVPLTSDEIFKLQHPQFYLDYLKTIEGLMIADGFLPEGSYETFSAEADVLNFWRNKGFPYFKGKGILSLADQPAFFRGLEEVKRLHAEEERALQDFYRGAGRSGVSVAVGATPAWLRALASLVSEAFLPPSAKAQTCYQSGFSTPAPGVNLVAPCCNCTASGVPIGCLNLMCAGRAAIFDQTTFICGCG